MPPPSPQIAARINAERARLNGLLNALEANPNANFRRAAYRKTLAYLELFVQRADESDDEYAVRIDMMQAVPMRGAWGPTFMADLRQAMD